jgi:RNA polymerase primary sigma factor
VRSSHLFTQEKSLEYYYREVDRHPPIGPEEEKALAARIEQGDEAAFDKLVKANLRFVIHVAKDFQNLGLSMADLINEGNLGLVTAARKFDRRKGCKFITYAVWWIRQNILNALDVQTRTIRVPTHILNDISKLRKASSRLAQSLERDPTPQEVADKVECTAEKVVCTMAADPSTVSLETPLYEETDVSLEESLPDHGVPLPDEAAITESMRTEVDTVFKSLSERHRKVLSLCFGLNGRVPATYHQIGTQLGVSRERVRQLKEDALRKLRQPALSKRLSVYVE